MAALGKEKAKLTVFSDSSTMSGALSVFEEGVELKFGGRATEIKKNYVDAVEKTGDRALGKVGVAFSYYDAFGNKETANLIMRDGDLKTLKKLLGK